MYLLGLLADKNIINIQRKTAAAGLRIFAAGVIINEILLAVQGFAAINYLYLPWLNIILFANTFTLVAGAILLFSAALKHVTIPLPFAARYTKTS
jgi:hypothetical protein